ATRGPRALRARVVRPEAPPQETVQSVLREKRSGTVPFVHRLPLSASARARVEAELQRAGVPLHAGEYLAIRLASAAIGVAVGLLLARRFGVTPPSVFVPAAVLFF